MGWRIGRGSRAQCSVIMQDGRSSCGRRDVVNVSDQVWTMAWYVAQGIYVWILQNRILVTGGSGESCWGAIGVQMEREINIAYRSENIRCVGIPVSVNKFIPECTELMLQFW